MLVILIVSVAAMLYTSPTLTLLMLAMVPPVSLGAARRLYLYGFKLLTQILGFLWSLSKKAIPQDAGSCR